MRDDRFPESCPGITEEFLGIKYKLSFAAVDHFYDFTSDHPIQSEVKNLRSTLAGYVSAGVPRDDLGVLFRFNREVSNHVGQDCTYMVVSAWRSALVVEDVIEIDRDCYITLLRMSHEASIFFQLAEHVRLEFPVPDPLGAQDNNRFAGSNVLNIYTSRHYDTDERLYSDFTKMTGIKIEWIPGKPDELITRIQKEGENTQADVFLTVDTTRLERAKAEGVLQPIESEFLAKRIPSHLRDDDNQWFGFSQRARIIFYDKNDVTDPPLTYVDVADPKYKGQVCHRSSSNVYSQTLMSAIIENYGEEAAKTWAQGMVDNFAREPQGGDTDQLRGLVSGECDIAISNTYYFARAIRKDVNGLGKDDLVNIGWVFPAQDAEGTHINLSGGGVVANAPHKENAIKFMEYLASDSAQEYFSAGNDEYPAVAGVAISPSVAALGMFKPDDVQASAIAQNLEAAQTIFNEVGWK